MNPMRPLGLGPSPGGQDKDSVNVTQSQLTDIIGSVAKSSLSDITNKVQVLEDKLSGSSKDRRRKRHDISDSESSSSSSSEESDSDSSDNDENMIEAAVLGKKPDKTHESTSQFEKTLSDMAKFFQLEEDTAPDIAPGFAAIVDGS